MAQDLKIAIVGAGIGGLTLAIALREHGIHADIYEQTEELREVGAAVALSSNATRFYDRMGLRPAFDGMCAEIPAPVLRDGRSGAVIGHHRGEPDYRREFGGSYWGVHRADQPAMGALPSSTARQVEPRAGDADWRRGACACPASWAGCQPVHRGRHGPGRTTGEVGARELARSAGRLRAATAWAYPQGSVRVDYRCGCAAPA